MMLWGGSGKRATAVLTSLRASHAADRMRAQFQNPTAVLKRSNSINELLCDCEGNSGVRRQVVIDVEAPHPLPRAGLLGVLRRSARRPSGTCTNLDLLPTSSCPFFRPSVRRHFPAWWLGWQALTGADRLKPSDLKWRQRRSRISLFPSSVWRLNLILHSLNYRLDLLYIKLSFWQRRKRLIVGTLCIP